MTSITSLEIVLYSVNFAFLEPFPVCYRHPVVLIFLFCFNTELLIQFDIIFLSLIFLHISGIYWCQSP